MAARGGLLAVVALIAFTLCAAFAQAQGTVTAREAYTRALALEASGNDAAALALLWQAAGAAPRDAEVQNRLGEALVRLGALDAAVRGVRRRRSRRGRVSRRRPTTWC